MTVRMPAMVPAQEAGWIALVEIASLMPTGWTLVGGQMVHLHCIEGGQAPMRATIDLDAILDVRARPHVLRDFTEVLAQLGFSSAGVSPWETSTVGFEAPRRSTCSSLGTSGNVRAPDRVSAVGRPSLLPAPSRRSTAPGLSGWRSPDGSAPREHRVTWFADRSGLERSIGGWSPSARTTVRGSGQG